jgi:hypothetical protein
MPHELTKSSFPSWLSRPSRRPLLWSASAASQSQGVGHRLRVVLRADGHEHACGKDGLHRPSRSCGVRAQSDRREGSGGSAECPRQRQANRTTRLECRCLTDCLATSRKRFLAGDRASDGRECENREASLRRAGQKPIGEPTHKCPRLSSDSP